MAWISLGIPPSQLCPCPLIWQQSIILSPSKHLSVSYIQRFYTSTKTQQSYQDLIDGSSAILHPIAALLALILTLRSPKSHTAVSPYATRVTRSSNPRLRRTIKQSPVKLSWRVSAPGSYGKATPHGMYKTQFTLIGQNLTIRTPP